jgi:hypothetical protein
MIVLAQNAHKLIGTRAIANKKVKSTCVNVVMFHNGSAASVEKQNY